MRPHQLVKNDWLEISTGKGFSFMVDKAGYFDERPVLNFYLTSLLSVLVMTPVGILASAGWWYWIITLLVFMFGRYHTFIKLPIHTGVVEFESKRWGVKYHDDAFWIHHGFQDYYVIHMPWDKVWVRTSLLSFESNPPEEEYWIHETKGNRLTFYKDNWNHISWSKTLPYTYERENGEVQETQATIEVKEREWRWRWFTWLPFRPFKKVEKVISIEFEDQIGERVDSWKGGVIGTGYAIKEGETPEEALRRMERNREFK